MKSNRRDFLKRTTAAGAGALACGILSGCSSERSVSNMPEILESVEKAHIQKFNMSGYAAPPVPLVRVGLIGLGSRGSGAIRRLTHIEGLEIVALADLRKVAVDESQKYLSSIGLPAAKEFYGDENAWKKLAELSDIDLVYICTPWIWHTPMAVFAMENGKHAVSEVPIARTVDEAWQLVETSERTKKHCMMLENCCYDFFELLTLNMARQGMFGDIIHCEGAYIHELVESNFRKPDEDSPRAEGYIGMWRLKENANRNGNLYPTHGLGPICQILNINRGDRMEYLTSMSTNDFVMGERANELATDDHFYTPFAEKKFRGNMNTSLIRTYLGKTIMLQHDVSSIRPYSRLHVVSGTSGVAIKYPEPPRIALGHSWFTEAEMKAAYDQFTPGIVKRVGELAKMVGGHGGMDFIMDWRLIDCLRNGLPLDQDVYDGALWSVIAPLSEWSVANRSKPIEIPDFTGGSWKTNHHHDIELKKGGNTKVLKVTEANQKMQLNV